MASLVKRGAQNPWVQMLIGGLANYTEENKKERALQEEYARKLALMDRERKDRESERSQEQTLADTRLQEQRLYQEGRTQEQRTYAETLAEQNRARQQQESIQQNDPTGRIAAAAGEASLPKETENSLSKEQVRIAGIDDPKKRLEAIEIYNPKNSTGQVAYASGILYDALKPFRESAEQEIRRGANEQSAVDTVNGVLDRPPTDPAQADAWLVDFEKALRAVGDSRVRAGLAKEGRVVYAEAKKSAKALDPIEKMALEAGQTVATRPLARDSYGDITETPQQKLQSVERVASTMRVLGGTADRRDSTIAGYPEPQQNRADLTEQALRGALTPDQLAVIRARQGQAGAEPSALPQSRTTQAVAGTYAPPPAVAAAMGAAADTTQAAAAADTTQAAMPEVENTAGLTPEDIIDIRRYAAAKSLSFNEARAQLEGIPTR